MNVASVDDLTVRAYAELKAQCHLHGHPLHDKVHDGDRWIAAAAIRLHCPLVSHDRIFQDVPGLDLMTKLEN